MVKYETLSHVFNYTWDHVATCFWKKYPNLYSTHVLSEDVLDRRMLEGGKLYTKRVIGKTNPLPKWGSAVFPSHLSKVCHVLEETVVDVRNRTMVSFTWNIDYKSLMDVKEKVSMSEDSGGTTACLKEGWVDSSARGFRHVLRKFGISRWRSNAVKAVTGYEHTLNKFYSNVQSPEITSRNRLAESTVEAIKDVKDKAKTRALDLATLAAAKKAQKEHQNVS